MDVTVPIELSVTLKNSAYSKDLWGSHMRKRQVKIIFLVSQEKKYPDSQFGKFQYLVYDVSCRKVHRKKQPECDRVCSLVGTSWSM